MITDVFNRLVSSVLGDCAPFPSRTTHHETCIHYRSCHAKCISPRYAEGDLSKGESVCIDRCVAKFFEVNKKVGEKLQNMGAGQGSTQSAFGSL